MIFQLFTRFARKINHQNLFNIKSNNFYLYVDTFRTCISRHTLHIAYVSQHISFVHSNKRHIFVSDIMKRIGIKTILLAAGFMLCAAMNISGREYSVRQVPNVQLHDAGRFVSNPDGILSAAVVETIDSMLSDLKSRGIAQIAVVAIDSMAGDDTYFFAHELLNLWGVGQKGKDNGMVVLVSKGQREIQMETGYGLEGILPDALLRRIQERDMIPYLSQGMWDEGTLAGIRAVYDVLNGEPDSAADDSDSDDGLVAGLFVIFMVLVTVIGSAIISRRQKKCPNCKKQGLGLQSSDIVSQSHAYTSRRYTYRCRYCGHITQKIVKTPNDTHIGGGPRGGGFSGGGFGGGSWGGGMSGGGGARSRF